MRPSTRSLPPTSSDVSGSQLSRVPAQQKSDLDAYKTPNEIDACRSARSVDWRFRLWLRHTSEYPFSVYAFLLH